MKFQKLIEKFLNPDKTDYASLCHDNGSENNDEFNFQMVAVESLVELSKKPFETNAVEVNEIEVIHLPDDDLMENYNSEVVKELGIKRNSQNEKTIQPSLTEIKSPEHINKTWSEQKFNCQRTEFTRSKNSWAFTGNFDSIKKVIDKTKSVGTECEAETSNSVLPTLSVPTIIRKNRVEHAITTNIETVEERGIDKSTVDKRQDNNLSMEEVDSLDSPCKSLERNDELDKSKI